MQVCGTQLPMTPLLTPLPLFLAFAPPCSPHHVTGLSPAQPPRLQRLEPDPNGPNGGRLGHRHILSSNTELPFTLPLFPVFCPGDIQGGGFFFASKMMVPSEKGLFTTFMAKLSCVGFDLGAPQKVRCISRLGYCAPFDAQFPICRWLVEGCAPCSHSPGAPDGSK